MLWLLIAIACLVKARTRWWWCDYVCDRCDIKCREGYFIYAPFMKVYEDFSLL